MKITDTIKERTSVRTFADRQLDKNTVDTLNSSIAQASSPFGGQYTIELKQFDLRGPLSPSTYGTISGASWYLLLGIHDDEASALSAGYAMEQVVLKATELGLGTCWMALTFKGADFMRGSDMPASTPLKIISPVGYPAGRRRMLESITRLSLGSAKRKPMDELFSEGTFGTPVSEGSVYYQPLAMMRLAPSAKNTQPWRALVQGDRVWFYYVDKTEASLLDLGIGLCHFSLTLEHNGHTGTWSEAADAPAYPGWKAVKAFTLTK